jgi:uncharacterized protein (DUF1800 family)
MPARAISVAVAASSIAVALASAATLVATGSAALPLSRADVRWLDRVTFGIDAATVAHYQRLGREKFLDEQLHPAAGDPAPLAKEVDALPLLRQTALERIKYLRAEQQRINSLANEEEKQQARTALGQTNNEVLYQTMKRHLMRDIESPWQLREQMTWFWMNHFNVFQGKANVRLSVADAEEQVRAHALGKFRDLVLATLTSPAMLEYLDNAQSAAGKINENYARELLELHTLGVSGGPSGSRYTQLDVQELARVLTGVGLNFTDTNPKLPPDRQGYYVRHGSFEFNPARHDFTAKTLLGTIVKPDGFNEVEHVVDALVRQPATARFISQKLATYFVSDEPPAALVDRMALTFRTTDGSIAAVLRTAFLDKTFLAATAAPISKVEKFKDPVQFVVSSLRLAYDGKTIPNYRPVIGWLQQLGEPLYGRVTPDGYPLTAAAWASSGQMVRRFEIARTIGSGSAGLFNGEDNKPGPIVAFPMLTTKLYYDAVEPKLSDRTRDALNHTASQQEWNTMLLSSPEWMNR